MITLIFEKNGFSINSTKFNYTSANLKNPIPKNIIEYIKCNSEDGAVAIIKYPIEVGLHCRLMSQLSKLNNISIRLGDGVYSDGKTIIF